MLQAELFVLILLMAFCLKLIAIIIYTLHNYVFNRLLAGNHDVFGNAFQGVCRGGANAKTGLVCNRIFF